MYDLKFDNHASLPIQINSIFSRNERVNLIILHNELSDKYIYVFNQLYPKND